MPSGHGFGIDVIYKVIDLYESGLNCGEVARIIDSTRETIRSILKRNGVPIRKSAPHGNSLVSKDDAIMWAGDYLSGLNSHQIAEKYKVSPSTVLKHLKKNNISLRENKKRNLLSHEQEIEVVGKYTSGLSMADCSVQYKVSINTICVILNRHGVETKKNRFMKFRSKIIQDKIVALYNSGWSLSLLAEEYGTCRDAIEAVLKIHNIPVKSYGELKGFDFIDRKGRKFFMRSGWEMKYARWLDDNEIEWDYEKESFDCIDCSYTPDFWVYKKNGVLDHLVEIKGYYTDKARKRIRSFKQKYKDVKLRMMFEKDLKKMGLIK